jgi:DNA modification methylase
MECPLVNFRDTFHLHDARRLTEILPSTRPCVSTTITSPPYWNLKDYGTNGQIGFGQTKKAYLSDLKTVFKSCLGVTKDTGSLWLVVDDYRKDGVLQILPWEMAECARKAGWKLRELIVWDKQHTLPWHVKGQMRNAIEFIFLMTKTANYKFEIDRIKMLDELSKWWVEFPERFNPKGKTPTNLWSIPVRTQGLWRSRGSKISHHCPFPTALVARMIELTTEPDDLIMDPFAGSGVVLAQAAAMNRHFVGFDISKKYARMFEKTVRKEVAAEWAEMQTWRENHQEATAAFEKTIMKLRALKYTRQVTRPFVEVSKTNKQLRIKAIVCTGQIPAQFSRTRPVKLKISVIVEQRHKKLEMALKKSLERTKLPPISHYGIRSEIEVVTYSAIKRRKGWAEIRLYHYPGSKPRKFFAKGTFRELLQNGSGFGPGKKSILPMLSNIAVDVSWAAQP